MRNVPVNKQGGVMLIEALIAIVIFSFGVLGLIGMQATAIKQAADAKLRGDASYLAGQIISQMWVDRSNLANYEHNPDGTDCDFTESAATSSNVTSWMGTASTRGTVLGDLPNARSQIKVETGTNLITVTICWRSPQERSMHNFTSTALISG